ncbi:TPA: hypothetical protein ACKQPR_003125 [Serratia odorifera]
MSESNNSIIEKRIADYGKYIDFFRSEVNTQGIWLFVATLGCLGVSNSLIRFFATFMLLFIFAYLVNEKNEEKRPFQKIEDEIKSFIESQLVGDERKARLYDLDLKTRYRKSVKNMLKKSPVFLSCYIFYSISLVSFIFDLPKN